MWNARKTVRSLRNFDLQSEATKMVDLSTQVQYQAIPQTDVEF